MKNLTKSQKSQIISFTFLSVLFLISLLYFLFRLLPELNRIENEKNQTLELVNTIDKIEKEWISYDDFQALKSTIDTSLVEDSKYVSEIINNIDKNFYDKNLVNTTEENYLQFVENLFKKYSTDKKLESDIGMLSNILPIYSNWFSIPDTKYLSDFQFINYIESILETFNISYNNFIWISELIILKDYMVWQWTTSLEENIFYIPITLDIIWEKAKILEFFYYIDNVWKISADENWISINSNFDKDFSTFSTKVLKSQEKTQDYNIFNNQMFDVESIAFKEYIDWSFDVNEQNLNFVNNIRNKQWSQKFEARVVLRFYVKWLPMYKIENDINEFIAEYSQISSQVQSLLASETSSIVKSKLTEFSISLEQINNNLILSLSAALSTREDLERLYMEVLKHSSILKEYKEYIENLNK